MKLKEPDYLLGVVAVLCISAGGVAGGLKNGAGWSWEGFLVGLFRYGLLGYLAILFWGFMIYAAFSSITKLLKRRQ